MIKISFLGDISLNDQYNTLYNLRENPFKEVSSILHDSDFVVGNLECLSESNDGNENLLKSPRLKTKINTLNYLKKLNLSLATLAHNHVYDNLLSGYLNTIIFLDNNNIDYLGAGLNEKESSRAVIKKIGDKNFCFLNYVTKDTNPNLPTDCELNLNLFDEDKVKKDIKNNLHNDFAILLLHWGGNFEGGNYPSFSQRQIAKRLINAGADLIIGHHSHTLQPYEKHKGKFIFYSLGNFCFADILSDGKIKPIDRRRFKKSMILSINIENNSIKIYKKFIKNNNLQIQQDKNGKFDYLIKQCIFTLMKRTYILWYVYYFFYKFIDPVFYQISTISHKNIFQRIKSFNTHKIKGLFR